MLPDQSKSAERGDKRPGPAIVASIALMSASCINTVTPNLCRPLAGTAYTSRHSLSRVQPCGRTRQSRHRGGAPSCRRAAPEGINLATNVKLPRARGVHLRPLGRAHIKSPRDVSLSCYQTTTPGFHGLYPKRAHPWASPPP
ncbi:hypothetical protein OE88DRAFT_1126245 [Heliocybe sulcata]|uniref:Uncharacterized protein n=1 Tax=Heliocybe sulcata TaxID=5364 RepID=A0A5C3N925_9AGAM|nr:hypothetical protein OE88DRAFT_1126245 [Heliocybe sulcata]